MSAASLVDLHRQHDHHERRPLLSLSAAGPLSAAESTVATPHQAAPSQNLPAGTPPDRPSLESRSLAMQQHQHPLPAPRNPPGPLPSAARSQNRLSSDMRNRGPLPVPSGPGAHLQNGHARNISGAMPFEMPARSPPNPSSKGSQMSARPLVCSPS